MANEAVLKVRLDDPFDWIVHDTLAIEKGTVLKISGVGIAARCETDDVDVPWAGIARREKIANDGRTRLAVFRRGIFDMKATPEPGITQGEQVAISGVNLIRRATTAEVISGKALGTAREDIAGDGTGEIILGGC